MTRQQQTVLASPVQGGRVQIVSNPKFEGAPRLDLKWRDTDGTVNHLNDLLVPPQCLSMFPEDYRYIHFTAAGIDIRDAQGRTLGVSDDKPATLPLSILLSSLSKNQLQEAVIHLWESETGLDLGNTLYGDAAPVTKGHTMMVLPKSFFEGESHALELGHQVPPNIKSLQAQLPARPCDALWLLDKFLTREYPNGGDVDMATLAVLPTAPPFWTKLSNFLFTPEYYHHPQRRNLFSLVEMATNVPSGPTTTLPRALQPSVAAMLTVLRGKITTVTRKLARGQGSRSVYRIGAQRPAGVIEAIDEPPLEELDVGEEDIVEGADDSEEDKGDAPEQPGSAANQAQAGTGAGKRKRAAEETEDDEEETIESARAGKRKATDVDRMQYFDKLDEEPDEMLLD
ncbi:hypothetical protein H2200_005360 [Cladophialophora chaetospira]|uniref:Uncharacterized protein n=1 Tax=Cladophialophora chaetospira TaxID=386627 RepID=A0AA38XBU6_9EURO|nr:hypothetical protein H2200_005360 [Cladophialophora chaetospira]